MIVTPEHLIKQYFPEPVETTRALYDRLQLDELGYPYLNWLNDLERYCLAQYLNDSDYKLLEEDEKNYWISQKAFRTIIEASPSKIGDQIRACVTEISNKVATDPAFARQLQDQLDKENGLETVVPKLSKQLKAQYNQTGRDAFEFSIQADTRLYLDIITGYNFQPGQKIKNVFFYFKLETENGVPYHIIDIALTLTNNDILSYRTVWCCHLKRLLYAGILGNRVIRVNLFQDNKKLVDSYEYVFSQSDIKKLEAELESIISMVMDFNLNEIDFDRLGEKILKRSDLNDQAYALAIKEAISAIKDKESAGMVEAAFLDAVDQYWKYYVLQPDPTRVHIDDLDQMVKDRTPRAALALIVINMLNYGDLCARYLKRRYSDIVKQVLSNAGSARLMYALAEATDFDPSAGPEKRVVDMCDFIADHFDLTKKVLIEMGQLSSR